jgi:hypothetical protein
MGQGLTSDEKKELRQTITPTSNGTVIVSDGTSAIEGKLETVSTPEGPKTVIIPLNKVYNISVGDVVSSGGQSGIVSGNKTYYLCAAPAPEVGGFFNMFGGEKNKGYIVGNAASKEGKCNVVFNNKPHAANKSRLILDDGKYSWTKTPANGVAYGTYGGEIRPICRTLDAVSGAMYAGNVVGDRCVASNGTDMYTSADFEYLDHL